MTDFEKLFSEFSQLKVAVIGDLMLDTYWWGHVERISPEAPVPIVALKKKELRMGGAANVALNTAALGASTMVISVIGDDAEGDMLTQLLQSGHIDTRYILASGDRITTNKTRIMGRNQQMMRLDAEMISDIDTVTEDRLLQQLSVCLTKEKPDVLIFEDYNKGVLTERIISEAINSCEQLGIMTAVDPKQKNFLAYKNATLFKPNLKEVKEGLFLNQLEVNIESLSAIHAALAEKLHHRFSLITLSEKGVFYQQGADKGIIPTHIRNIADVSGAGDTVIAVASLAYRATQDVKIAAEMANIAGGMVCEDAGTVAINRNDFLAECQLLLN